MSADFAPGDRVIVSWMGDRVETTIATVEHFRGRYSRIFYRVQIGEHRPAYEEHEVEAAPPEETTQ